MSLFLKIFLWFWVSIALVVGVLSFINWTTQPENLRRQWQSFTGEVVGINARTAAQIYEREGRSGLEEYLNRLQTPERVSAIGFYDENGDLIAGKNADVKRGDLFERAAAGDGDTTELDVTKREVFAVRRVQTSSGGVFFFAVNTKRPTFSNSTDAQTLALQIAGIVLTAGLGCYGLARYLSSPISKLRLATRELAGGDLQTRVAEKVGNRRDELASLARDFDEMAERIETLLNSQKRLTQDVSHELRSPLARLNVALEIAKQKTNPESAPLLDRIEKESNRLNEMISRLLVLSKLEAGVPDFEKRELNLTKLVEQTVADADFEAKGKGKAVRITEKIVCNIFGNETLLRSAVENVLRNAVRYTKDGSTVEVSVKKASEKIEIRIKDCGAGVADNELEKLFRPFYRVGEDRDRRTGGIGLGLAIAERAVHAHGGTIKAENASDGFVVEINLPLKAVNN